MRDAPWFEDFSVGDEFSDVPSVTLTDGHIAVHQALFGDRLRLVLDHTLAHRVTGEPRALVPASLVCNIAIGQSTIPSQRVMGNLFYRGLVLKRPVFVGDTLTTKTRVVALRQNTIKPGRAASGMVALEIHVTNQNDETVMLFWRCPMIPCRDRDADTGLADSFDFMPAEIGLDALKQAVPAWNLSPLTGHRPEIGQATPVESRDTVTLAPELVRMTLNLAMTHTDAGRSVYGKRLVYGGHTISMAAAQVTRVLPAMATTLGWFKCDHTGPVFEGDILSSTVTLESVNPADTGDIGIINVRTFAERGAEAPEPGADIPVLDWRFAALLGPTEHQE